MAQDQQVERTLSCYGAHPRWVEHSFGEEEEKAKEHIYQGGSPTNPGDQESGHHEVHTLSDPHPAMAVSESQGSVAY